MRLGEEPDPRFSLANERTLLAWVRTSLGLAAAGLAAYAFAADEVPAALLTPLAVSLLAVAGLIALAALQRWFAVEVALRQGRPLPLPWLALPVVALLALAVLAGIVLVLR
ncbi:DUF202 domain-containing protein [Nocardioides zeae]|uniref:DUF202 domain-containing protein n=1 Tax=Nocardioides imazamoxiresistens TaxID=3231893 RepID=A0ABU3PUA5_9ACTN|nr:DUF202 domain-containing protein [Nocardioides zeae]MDT9592798.1 DUF202 domain-containing protein [Nocardioides zeae]